MQTLPGSSLEVIKTEFFVQELVRNNAMSAIPSHNQSHISNLYVPADSCVRT